MLLLDDAAAPAEHAVRAYAALPSPQHPLLYVPLDRRNVAAYVLRTRIFPRTALRALRKEVLVRAPGLVLRTRRALAVAAPGATLPAVVEAAVEAYELGPDVDFFLACGQGDELARAAFVLFRHGRPTPEWTVKFARVPDYADPFEGDDRGYALVAAAGGAAARRSPRPLGRLTVAGHEAAVETAAVGTPLDGLLGAACSRRAKLAIVDAVARWLVEVGAETAGEPASAELARIRAEVLPRWPALPECFRGLETVPGVLQHNDLGSWNVVWESGAEFTVLDWESARGAGLPLWDLWYFLADALRLVDGRDEDPVDAFRGLFRGDRPSSPFLFSWTRAAAASLGLAPPTVRALATLCWLHHGLSHRARSNALRRHVEDASGRRWPAQDYPAAWLEDPELGESWSHWERP